MRVSKTNKLVTRPVNKLYLVERFSCEDIDVNTNTVFSLLNAQGVYIFFLILRWASIGEGR